MKKKEISVVNVAEYFAISVFTDTLLYACNSIKALFASLQSISNRFIENYSIHVPDNEYVYNGKAVAIAEFNNDNPQDIYFTRNLVGNTLYVNKGLYDYKIFA